MRPALKLDVMIAHPSYGGNGGISSEHPDIRDWEVETILKMKKDPRVGEIMVKTIADTPITMVRNQFVRLAQQTGAHLLLMVDSDQSPLRHRHDSWYKPFWDVAFDAIYEHYQRGPLVVGAPYCGPPPFENVYVFQFESNMSELGRDETVINLQQYTRSQASMMTGLGEVAALPTGMILFDMRVFDICKPSPRPRHEVLEQLYRREISPDEAAKQLTEGWFYYEWTNGFAAQKASTEDVTATRDIGLAVARELGYNPLRCAWDSWIGHHKPWNCGRPTYLKVENVSDSFAAVVRRNHAMNERIMEFRSPILDELTNGPAAK